MWNEINTPVCTAQALAQPQARVFSPIVHYFSTFVQQEPAFIYAHLVFVVIAGNLWHLQDEQALHPTVTAPEL